MACFDKKEGKKGRFVGQILVEALKNWSMLLHFLFFSNEGGSVTVVLVPLGCDNEIP